MVANNAFILTEMKQKAIQEGIEEGKEKGREEGRKKGIEEGREEGIELTKKVFKLYQQGKTVSEISIICEITEVKVQQILN